MSQNAFSGPELCALSAREVVARLKRKEIKPSELIDATLERAAQVEPAVNAMPTLCGDRARASLDGLSALEAENGADPAWLGGLPIGIKDLTPVAGVRTTYGSTALADNVPTVSDPLVEMMESRGGVVIGKTNTPEFGAGGNTFNEVFGMTRNPWDTRKNAGGSSGGAAVSLATGEVWLSHGSDLAGSLRTPAAYCGVVGMRPTPGRCGGGPAEAGFLIEGVQGPMARDVSDLALFLDAMTGFDPRMPISLDRPAEPFQAALTGAEDARPRIAFSPDQGGFAPVEKEIREVLTGAMAALARAGAEVEEACPSLPKLNETYVAIRGVHYGVLPGRAPERVQAAYKETLRLNVEVGKTLTPDQIYDAMRQRTVLYHNMRRFLEGYDVLAIPVVGLEPGMVEEEYPRVVDGQPLTDYVEWLRFSFLATTTALPAIAMPAGRTASGMPVGVQLIGPPRGEAKLLKTARFIEAALDGVLGKPTSAPIDPVAKHAG